MALLAPSFSLGEGSTSGSRPAVKRRRAAPEQLLGSEGWAPLGVEGRPSKRTRVPPSLHTPSVARPATKTIQQAQPDHSRERKLLWVAMGVSVTPFLVLLRALGSGCGKEKAWDIELMLYAGPDESDALLPRVADAAGETSDNIRLSVEVFSDAGARRRSTRTSAYPAARHRGAITVSSFRSMSDLLDREVYISGSDAFEVRMWDALRGAGVPPSRIKRDGFEY